MIYSTDIFSTARGEDDPVVGRSCLGRMTTTLRTPGGGGPSEYDALAKQGYRSRSCDVNGCGQLHRVIFLSQLCDTDLNSQALTIQLRTTWPNGLFPQEPGRRYFLNPFFVEIYSPDPLDFVAMLNYRIWQELSEETEIHYIRRTDFPIGYKTAVTNVSPPYIL